MAMKIVFMKGSKKPWKIQNSKGEEMGAAITKALAQKMSEKMGAVDKPVGGTGVDAILENAINNAPGPMKDKLAAVGGKKVKEYVPARGQMEGESSSVSMGDDHQMEEEEVK